MGFLSLLARLVCTFALSVSAAEAQRSAAQFAAQAQPIPFEFFRRNRIFLSGRVNGRPVTMLLDNGASSSVIDRQSALRLGLPAGRRATIRGAGGVVESRSVPGVTLTVGPLTIGNATVLVIDLSDISRRIGRPVEVILGLEAFRAGIVDIDFAARTISFRPGAGFSPPAEAVTLPVTDRDGRRTIPVSINGAPAIAADLDLGSAGTVMVSHDYWSARLDLAGLRFAPTLAGGVGGLVRKRMVTTPSVTLAGVAFENVPVLLNQGARDLPETGANVGIELLQRFRTIFDHRRGMLHLIPNREAIARPLAKNRTGLGVDFLGDRLRVIDVVPDSPAAEAGWRIGDEVIAVNGVAVDARYYERPDSGFSAMPAGARVELTRSDARILPIVLRDYF